MAKRPSRSGVGRSETDEAPELLVPASDFGVQLEQRIEIGVELSRRQISTPHDLDALKSDGYLWDQYNATLIRRAFSTSKPADDYGGYAGPLVLGGRDSLAASVRDQFVHLNAKVDRLRSLREQLPLYEKHEVAGQSPDRSLTGRDVFVVHGHNEAAKQEVARFIQKVCHLEPIILHEQPNEGRTIIEKLEEISATVGFAVVLLTADDEGGIRGTGELQLRGRQNVVLELGLFIGLIGRRKVAVLHESGVELPSDMSGVLYTPLDQAGGWRIALAKELVAANMEIDSDQLLR